MNLSELQKEAHAIAVAHGWWDHERTFGELIALVHSELSEALEAYRQYGDILPRLRRFNQIDGWSTTLADEHGGQPVGVPSELADVVIRVADMAESYNVGLVSVFPKWSDGYLMPEAPFGEQIAFAHLLLTETYLLFQHGIPLVEDVSAETWEEALCNCVAFIQRMAEHYGIDLEAAIEAKREYNRTRSYRHGGKVL